MTSSLVGSEMCIRDRLWDLSTSVEIDRRGPLLISQLKSTAKMYMQEDMGKDENLSLIHI
eukprot:360406-Prorocentrum_lima.AAC.1